MTSEQDDRDIAAKTDDAASNEAPNQTGNGGSVPTMDELMDQYEAAAPIQDLHEGDVVVGTVVQIDDNGAMVDVGTKSEGLIPRSELDLLPAELEVGQEVEVYVQRIEDEDGNLIISKRQADYERAWEEIVDKQDSNEVLEARVVEAVKGGLLVDLGVYGQGFVPASHVSVRRPRNLQKYVGETLRLQVIEVERKRKRVVLSHRKVMEEERAAEREQTLLDVVEGQVRLGVVRRITDFGAFVDIGGVDGLLHVSELSWRRVEHPEEELRVNQDLEVMILKLNLEENRISLGRRQLMSDPWREVPKIYREGQVVRAKVVRLLGDGAVVRLPIGIDGRIDVPPELLGLEEAAADEAAEETVVEPAAETLAPEAEAETGAVPEVEAEVAAAADEVDAAEATDEADAAEATTEAEATEATDEAEAAEATEATDEAEAAEATDEAEAAEATDEAEAVEATDEAEAVEATDEAEAAEATDEAGQAPSEPAMAVGSEVEVRIDRIVPVERELMLALASSQPLVEPRERDGRDGGDRPAPRSGAPLARGRYSDARLEEDVEEQRQEASRRRRRERDRDRDRDRDGDRSVPTLEQAGPPPARRTLGDLVGDQLRALVLGGEDDGDSEETSQKGESAEEASDDTAN